MKYFCVIRIPHMGITQIFERMLATLSRLVQAIMLLTLQILARTPAVLTEVVYGSPQSLQANAGVVPKIVL
jgi:hypothetical protein